MSFTKLARIETSDILGIKGSQTKRTASLDKFADFDEYRTEDGYLYARIRAISSRVNKNHDGWPSVELAGSKDIFDRHLSSEGGFTVEASKDAEYGFSTFLGKPIFVDHNNSDPERARGVIVDAKLHVEDHRTASDLDPYYSSAPSEHLPPTWVELLLEVDAKSFPKFAKEIIEGSKNPSKGIDGFSMGCDVERSVCSICKHSAVSPDEFCNHIRMKGAHFDYVDDDGHKTSRQAYEDCYGIRFFEISGVFDPADHTALSMEVRTSTHQSDAYKRRFRSPSEEQGTITPEGMLHVGPQDTEEPEGYPPLPVDTEMVADRSLRQGLLPGNELAGQSIPHPGAGDLGTGGFGLLRENPWPRGPRPSAPGMATDMEQHEQLQRLPKYQGADNVAEKCPQCDSHTTGLTSTEGDAHCHSCGHDYKMKGLVHDDVKTSSVKTAENPLPQGELIHAPEDINTLREEMVCPVCGSTMDEETCDVCGYIEPPEGFDNPDLDKAKEESFGQPDQPEQGPNGDDMGQQPSDLGMGQPGGLPENPGLTAHVRDDMASWKLSVHPKVAARLDGGSEDSDEPQETVVSDQTSPVTSQVRTASDFVRAAGRNKETTMERTAEAASGAPAVAKPEVNTEVEGVGGVLDGSNEEASKADAQIEVEGEGGTGVESVAPDSTSTTETGNEHSKNIEAIPTKTFDDGSSAVERQSDPVGGDVFPAADEGVKASGHQASDPGNFPEDDGGLAGGNANQGTQPSDPVGKAEDRVNVLDTVTTPENNSGPTKTWTGTDGNSVTRQQDPTTNETLEGEDIVNLNPKGSSHIIAAFRLADLEVELGMLGSEQKYARVAELEAQTPGAIQTQLAYAQKVRTAGLSKGVAKTAKKLPVLGRNSNVSEEQIADPADDDYLLFS